MTPNDWRPWRKARTALLILALTTAPIPSNEAEIVAETPVYIGGVGGLYLLAEPGTLTVEIRKRDLPGGNNPTHLRAILLGPDRRNLSETLIEGDGSARLSTEVVQKGVYAVNVTVSHDRYGERVRWGFTTNCEKVLIETSRGHKDARHLEPIVLDAADQPGDVCFAARQGAIGIEIDDVPAGSAPTLFDPDGNEVARLPVNGDGTAAHTLTATDTSTDRPWRLHFPSAKGTLHIDGVTRWERGEPYENLSLWSTNVDRWFPFHDLRWMLRPYRHTFTAQPDTAQEVELRLHNNGTQPDTLDLNVAESDLDISLSDTTVTLAPDEEKTIAATVTVPSTAAEGDTWGARVSATSRRHPDLTTWSTIEARVAASATTEIDIPIVYRPYEHENEQFAYTPDYPNDNQIYFSPDNRPFIRVSDGVLRLDDRNWRVIDTVDGEHYRAITSKVAFGASGEICLIGRSGDETAYLYSTDGGDTFTATVIPRREAPRQQWDIESFTGHNRPAGPAPFLRASETGEYDPTNFWRHVNDLELFLPSVVDGKVVVGEPILLSTQAIGISSHSGIPSSIVSMGDRVHIVWGEATDPDGDEPGVPAFVATYDRAEKRLLGEKAFVGFGPPANDVHNTPSIVIDSEGYLHTLTGTHGQPFAYARSLEPHTAHAGFTEPELVEEELRSTYIGFVCDPDDTLHLVFRTWKTDGAYHAVSHYANLAYKRKPKGQPWEPMKRLAVAPFTEYSIWYHRLTMDRKGRLFVSFDYWSTFWFYRVDHHGNSPGRGRGGDGGRRKTIMSADGGETWKLLETRDL